jgi:hypothetical protein
LPEAAATRQQNRIPYRSGARYSSSVMLIYARRDIREAARSVNVLPRAAKPF